MNLHESINNILNVVELQEGMDPNSIKKVKKGIKVAISSIGGGIDYLEGAEEDAYLDKKMVKQLGDIRKTFQDAESDLNKLLKQVK